MKDDHIYALKRNLKAMNIQYNDVEASTDCQGIESKMIEGIDDFLKYTETDRLNQCQYNSWGKEDTQQHLKSNVHVQPTNVQSFR